jgi:hypothetical protein
MTMFEALQRRENYEHKMRKENPPRERLKAFIRYNAAYLITIVVWILDSLDGVHRGLEHRGDVET